LEFLDPSLPPTTVWCAELRKTFQSLRTTMTKLCLDFGNISEGADHAEGDELEISAKPGRKF
jgi:hypothetical protein